MVSRVIFSFVFVVASITNPTSATQPDKSIKAHKIHIQNCTDNNLDIITGALELYVIRNFSSITISEIKCIFPDQVLLDSLSTSKNATIYKSLIDKSTVAEEDHFPLKEAVIQENNSIIIVAASSSDIGITQINQVQDNLFLLHVGHLTKRPTYLVKTDPYNFEYLTNGRVKIENANEGIFRVYSKKAYFKNVGGAFWFDALVNTNGSILDIVTGKEPKKSTTICMTRNKLARKSNLDLNRVPKGRVCVKR